MWLLYFYVLDAHLCGFLFSGIGMSMNSILEFMNFRIHGLSYNLSPSLMATLLMKDRISVLKDLMF